MAGPTKTADRRRRADTPRAHPPSRAGAPPAGRSGRGSRLPRRRTLLLVLVLALALSGCAVWALYFSHWLRVEHVSVTGTRVLTERQVREAARVPLGEPLAGLDTDEISHRLTGRLPRLAGADVERDWPDTVALRLTERTAVLAVRRSGKYDEVDAEGVRFATASAPPRGVPLLELEAEASSGRQWAGAGRLRRAAARVADALPESLRRDTRTVRVRSYDSVTLELAGGRTVMWGSAEHGKDKARTLTALMKAERDAEHFDVSAPSAPAASGS